VAAENSVRSIERRKGGGKDNQGSLLSEPLMVSWIRGKDGIRPEFIDKEDPEEESWPTGGVIKFGEKVSRCQRKRPKNRRRRKVPFLDVRQRALYLILV